jgi:hypothetical protein
MLRNAKYLEIARAIFDAREAVKQREAHVAQAKKHLEEAFDSLATAEDDLSDLEAQFDAGFDGEPSSAEEVPEARETPRVVERPAVLAETTAQPATPPPPYMLPPWVDPATARAERARVFLSFHGDHQFTAVEIAAAIQAPAKSVNQILSRELERGFVFKPDPNGTAYQLAKRPTAIGDVMSVFFPGEDSAA